MNQFLRAVGVGGGCIPKATVHEGAGTVGETDVSEPAHCNDGLACSDDGTCIAIPDCSQAKGLCALSRASADVTTAAGGVGGTGGAGGDGAFGGIFPTPPPASAAANTGHRLRMLAADDSHVYWIDHGTFDASNNYNNDGALMAYDGQSVHAVASSLKGPELLYLTSAHAYLQTDGGRHIDDAPDSEWLRVPLTGGASETVPSDPSTAYIADFTAIGDRAFFSSGQLYQISPDPGAAISLFEPALLGTANSRLGSDAEYVYFVNGVNPGGDNNHLALQRVSVAGEVPQILGSMQEDTLYVVRSVFAIHGDCAYFLTWNDDSVADGNVHAGLTLDRIPKAGGSWERVRSLGVGFPLEIHVFGDNFFWTEIPYYVGQTGLPMAQEIRIYAASFTSDAAPILVATIPSQGTTPSLAWAVNQNAVYWTPDGRTIFARPIADLF